MNNDFNEKKNNAFKIGDFKLAVLLSLTSIAGIRKSVPIFKELWFDKALHRAINRIEKRYIPAIIFVVGALVIWYIGILKWLIAEMAFVFVLWILADLLLINPLVYYSGMPKPVQQHIKYRCDLTEEEQAIQKKREEADKSVNRILKKYEKSGKSEYFGYDTIPEDEEE